MPETVKPDFFIAGAPKCGTSALHAYLSQHPGAFLPDEKEPNFFGGDLTYISKRLDLPAYLALFRGGKGKARVGEASVSYFYSEAAAGEIRAFNPAAKIVILLRDPVDMMAALHSEHVFTGNEGIEEFDEALAAETERRGGRHPWGNANPRESVLYRMIADFPRHVERFFNVFGRERVHVVVFDDFKRDTAAAYTGVLRFLELDPGHRPTFDTVNPNKANRARFIRDLVRRPPPPLRWLAKSLLPSKNIRDRVARALLRLNSRVSPRPPLPPERLRFLRREWAPSVEKLGRLLNRDLSRWSRDSGEA